MRNDEVIASIAICTRNRAASLRETLLALERTEVPDTIPVEVLVVDNGSHDETAEVVEGWRQRRFSCRLAREPRPGVAHARNTAVGAARGRVIVFVDDDVRVPRTWLEPMCRPILAGTSDAVAGGVVIPVHLRRAWMEPLHRAWLASTEYLDASAPREMVSANMAIGRHVLARVPAFDTELGPGALGQGEDALFSWQLRCAGFRIEPALDVAVEHHFDARRLSRASLRDTAVRRGRTMAYQRHHWEHEELRHVAPRLVRRAVELFVRRLRPNRQDAEGMSAWEMLAIEQLAFLRHWRIESRRPRNYERHGLVKLAPS